MNNPPTCFTQILTHSLTLFMQRCGAFVVVSDFTDIPDSGPVKILLVKVLRMLKKSVGEKGDEDSVIEQALIKVLEVVLEKKTVASLEYFCRAWTLAGAIRETLHVVHIARGSI